MKAQTLGIIREFRTAQFLVVVDALEDYDVDLSFDESDEVRKRLESGEYVCFTARARVIHDDLGELAADYLGGCIYKSLAAFEAHRECGAQQRAVNAKRKRQKKGPVCIGSYFSDMVKTVCKEARERAAELRLNAAAPALLAAAELLVGSHTKGTDAWPAIIAARYAIDKARAT